MDKVQELKKIIPEISLSNLTMSDNYIKKLTPIPDYAKILKTPEDRDRHLTDRLDNTNRLLEESNHRITELQSQLDNTYIQLRQANDKVSSQTLYIKELKSDLREESLKKELAESKVSAKDWKVAFIALLSALIMLGVEHSIDFIRFIQSLAS